MRGNGLAEKREETRSLLGAAACVALVALGLWVCQARADELNVVVDNKAGQWRVFTAFETPQLTTADGKLKPLRAKPDLNNPVKEEDRAVLPVKPCAKPPEGWQKPEFDDSSWPRQTGAYGAEDGWTRDTVQTIWDVLAGEEANPADHKIVCLRGKFDAVDPEACKDLQVTVEYHGGLVVYVNGKEIKRAHLPAGPITLDTQAEGYPKAAYVKPEFQTLESQRRRKLEVEIKPSLLRKGVNVVAIEVHRAAVSDIMDNLEIKTWGHAFVRRAMVHSAYGMVTAAAAKPYAEDPGAAHGEPASWVLSNARGYWRFFTQWRTPEVISEDGAVSPLRKRPDTRKNEKYADCPPLPLFASPEPPPDWAQPDFDDFQWPRVRGEFGIRYGYRFGYGFEAGQIWLPGNPTEQAVVCVRGKFQVADPAKCQDLEVVAHYVGGAVVLVNGKELTRAHVPAGPITAATVATGYRKPAYFQPNGIFLPNVDFNNPKFGDMLWSQRMRVLRVAIPPDMLRKGVNVVAAEVHRAPVLESAVGAPPWAHALLHRLTVRSRGGDAAQSGAQANFTRPDGAQVWVPAPLETVTSCDYADPCEPPRPVSIVGVRKGFFSGRFVLSSTEPLKNIRISAGELARQDGRKLPASAISLRCAEPAVPSRSWAPAHRFDGLITPLPAETAVSNIVFQAGYDGKHIARQDASAAAMVPVWLTVRVPADAEPGLYEGQVAIEADETWAYPPHPVSVKLPVRVKVIAWTLPAPKDFSVRNLGFLMTEGLATYYKVPVWSDRHFELLGKSMERMLEIGSKQAVINLCEQFTLQANKESMVRWIKQADGSFKYDFSVVDKYLDTVAAAIGKPDPLRINIWRQPDKDGKIIGPAKNVTLFDPATGKLSTLEQPSPIAPETVAFWKPVLDELKRRLDRRGWGDVAAVGDTQYCGGPKPQTVSMLKQMWPDVLGVSTQHGLASSWGGVARGDTIPVPYAECVWDEGAPAHRGYKGLLKPHFHRRACGFNRNRHAETLALRLYRSLPENMIMAGMSGLGPLGGDLWPIPNERGGFWNVSGSSAVGPGCSTKAIMAPGPDGPVPTERFEMFREGMQLCEAIFFLQRALDEKKIEGELASRVNRLLDDRSNLFLRTRADDREESGPLDGDEQLYALAAEVAAALDKKQEPKKN